MPNRARLTSTAALGLGALAALAAGALLPGAPEALGEAVAAPAAQATAVSPQPTPVSPQPTPPARRELRFYSVAPRFERYYAQVEGFRVMGRPISPLGFPTGLPSQYFEKARLEDHTATEARPEWQYQYGLLVDELLAVRSPVPLGGDRSTLTYAEVTRAASVERRIAPPLATAADALTGAVTALADGSVFVPFSADLSPAPGHAVPVYFWEYLNREDLFPGGWLHDVGLPLTEPLAAIVDKGIILDGQLVRVSDRPITVQAFQRTVLTYDPANPAGWQVERANVGTDYHYVFPERVPA